MDERYFAYFDDSDFMLRAWKKQYKLFRLPEAKLWHKVSSLTGVASPFAVHYTHRNHALYLYKNCPLPVAWFWSVIYRSFYLLTGLIDTNSRAVATQKMDSWRQGIEAATKTGSNPPLEHL